MKKIAILLVALPFVVAAQKEIKPSVSKAESALQKGNFDEAKSIIDATVASQEYMIDKKGGPSKNSKKAWYLRGLIYIAIDTTKIEKFKSLEADPFTVAQQSFEKCDCNYASYELMVGMSEDKVKQYFEEPTKINNAVTNYGGSDQWVYPNQNNLYFKNRKLVAYQAGGKPIDPKIESYVNKVFLGQQLPMSNVEVAKNLSQKYLERGYAIYQKKDYKNAFVDIEKVLFFLPNDTTQLMNAGVFFAPAAGENEKALAYLKSYKEEGGKHSDAILGEYSVYTKYADNAKKEGKAKDKNYDPLRDSVYMKNMNASLKAIKELGARYPDNMDYLNLEYNIYTQTNQLPEAKVLMEKRASADPKDRESRYFLGLICNELKDFDGAKHWMAEALKVDPDYFEANLVLGKLIYADAQKMRNDRNAITGTKEADLKKRQDLYKQIPLKLKESVAYWEKCMTINASDEDVLYGILSVYSDISLYDESYEPKIVELKKKMKALGLEVD